MAKLLCLMALWSSITCVTLAYQWLLIAMMWGETMLRSSLGVSLTLLGVLGATAAGSVTAYASPAAEPPADTFTVVSAGAATGNPDQLTVVVDSPSTISDLTAQLVQGGYSYSQALTAQTSETDPSDSTQTQSTWTANIPVGTSGLPLGSYVIDLNGTFADSTSYTLDTTDGFSFDATSSVTLTAASTNLRYPNTEAGLSGTVSLTYPDGTADTDYTGVSVLIMGNIAGAVTIPIASDGTFSDPSFAPAASETIAATVAGTGVEASMSGSVALTVINTTPTLKLKVNPVTETYGKSATVTGTVTYASGSSSQPLADQEIWISGQESGGWNSPVATGKTGANGTFSIQVPAEQKGTTLYVGTLNLPDLTAVETPLEVDVVNPTVISSFKVSLNQYWNLSVSGCLGFSSGNKAQTFSRTSGLTVQYKSVPNGPWKNLFTISGNEADTRCGTGGIKFTGSYFAPQNYAYYRVVYAGTKGATSYAATTSGAVLAWRYADRITGYKVSPSVVNAGGKLTIKGTLQYYYSGWHNYSGQTIWIYLRPKGSSTWYWMVKVKTNSKGQFTATFKDPVSATWEADFEGNNSNGVGHLAAASPDVYVRLK